VFDRIEDEWNRNAVCSSDADETASEMPESGDTIIILLMRK
jgi:hypothetical protein